MKKSTGFVFRDKSTGRWCAKITRTDAVSGRRIQVRRSAGTKSEASEILAELRRDFGQAASDVRPDRLTFRQLAERYKDARLFPAEFRDGKKTAGLKSWKTPTQQLAVLTEFFGDRLARSIRPADIAALKRARLAAPTHRGGKRTITTVNKELSVLRSVFRFAVGEGWLEKSPFEATRGLIQRSAETKREKILTREEEARLLAACDAPKRRHLRPFLIVALDTGLRRGELFNLKWGDVDFDAGTIKIRATTTKTETARTVGMTPRVAELLKAKAEDLFTTGDEVFGAHDVKKAFASACRAAGIEGLRLHDLRHTAITRMVRAGLPHAEVMKISGHSQMTTFLRYVNTDVESARSAARALAEFLQPAFPDEGEDFETIQ